MSALYAAIGERLLVFRKARSLTQADAGRTLGITQSAYARIESGETPLRIDQLIKLAAAWKVSARKFLGSLLD